MKIISVGVDLVEIGRIEKSLADPRLGERFRKRIFTEGEEGYCSAQKNPPPHYAARFAAKEAVYKALRGPLQEGVGWREIEVVPDERGAPDVRLSGRAAEALRALCPSGRWRLLLSLSHANDTAAAYVVLVEDE